MGKHTRRITYAEIRHEATLYKRYLVNRWRFFTRPKLEAWLKRITKH